MIDNETLSGSFAMNNSGRNCSNVTFVTEPYIYILLQSIWTINGHKLCDHSGVLHFVGKKYYQNFLFVSLHPCKFLPKCSYDNILHLRSVFAELYGVLRAPGGTSYPRLGFSPEI